MIILLKALLNNSSFGDQELSYPTGMYCGLTNHNRVIPSPQRFERCRYVVPPK